MGKTIRGIVVLLCVLCLMGCSDGAGSLAELEQMEELEEIAQESVKESGVAGISVVNSKVPAEYRELFEGGSFDENGIWASDKAEYADLIEDLKKSCEENLDGSMIFATDDEIIFAGGWNATEIDEKTIVNPYTTYEIGTMTVSMTAAAILQLVQEEKLKMTDTIDTYFPDYPYGEKITIEHLLYMTAGIPDVLCEPKVFFASAEEEGKDPEQVGESFINGQVTEGEMLDYLYKTKPGFEPGTDVWPSTTNFILLAHILEQVTGQSYEEYMKENIFDVCGMKNSTCAETGNMTSVPIPSGEDAYLKCGEVSRGASDIHSSPCDVLLFNRALMAGRLIDYNHLSYVKEPKSDVSCGWFVEKGYRYNLKMDEESDAYVLMQTGGTNGYFTINYIYSVGDKNYYHIMMSPSVGRLQFTLKLDRLISKYMESLGQ